MKDPYKVLGVSPNDSDEEIKSAYRKLAKKYHSDNYENSPLRDLATEKMKEINEAYDTIIKERKNRKSSGNSYYNSSNKSNSKYIKIRNLIINNRISEAEQIINNIPEYSRDAEWHFLKGTILYKKGWLEESYEHFNRAYNIDPTNREYKAALEQLNRQRSGQYGGYNTSTSSFGGCSACDICSSLICADCCCECMGGDCIRCC